MIANRIPDDHFKDPAFKEAAKDGPPVLGNTQVYLGAQTYHSMSVPPGTPDEEVIAALVAAVMLVAPPFFLTPDMLQFEIVDREPCPCGKCGREHVVLARKDPE